MKVLGEHGRVLFSLANDKLELLVTDDVEFLFEFLLMLSLDDLADFSPEDLDLLGDKGSLALDLLQFLSGLAQLTCLTALVFLEGSVGEFLGNGNLPLSLLSKVVGHPGHLVEDKVPVGFLALGLRCLGEAFRRPEALLLQLTDALDDLGIACRLVDDRLCVERRVLLCCCRC